MVKPLGSSHDHQNFFFSRHCGFGGGLIDSSNRLIVFPEKRLADFLHIPAINALGELVAGAMDTFEGGPHRQFGTKQQNFSEMAQHREGDGNAGDEEGPLIRQPMKQGNPRPDWADMELGEIRGGLATHLFRAEVFDEDAARITTRDRQTEEPTSQVIVLDAANVTALVREGLSDGAVKGHAFLAGIEGRGAKGAVKAARSNVKVAGIGLNKTDEMPEIPL